MKKVSHLVIYKIFWSKSKWFRNVIFTFCTLVSNLYTSSFFDRLGSWRVRDLLRKRVFRDLLRNFFREFPDASPNVVYILNFLLNFQTFFFSILICFALKIATFWTFLNCFEFSNIFCSILIAAANLRFEKHFQSCFY